MPLSDTSIRALRPKAQAYKVSDDRGLYLQIMPTGRRLWKMKFRASGGVEKKLSFGAYPEVTLKEARDLRDRSRALLANGVDPAEKKRRDKHAAKVSAANTFEAIAGDFIAKNRRDGLAEATLVKREWFVRLVQRRLGGRPIAEIQPFEILEAVKPFEAAKNDEKAHRTLQFIGQVFRYAVANQLVRSDPTRDLRGALANRRPKNLAAILDPRAFGGLLRDIDAYDGLPLTKLALQLAPLVFVRPGELRRAEWAEVDIDQAVWRIPPEKMKARKEHVVPLARQAIAILREVEAISGGGRFVFPSVRSRSDPMSENTLNAALRRLGYTGDEMTAHGFRSTASTLLNESGKWSPDAIERALAHQGRDLVRAAYHRGAHWQERVRMAQWWADHLDGLRTRVASRRQKARNP